MKLVRRRWRRPRLCGSGPATDGTSEDDLGGRTTRFLATRPPGGWHRGIARWSATTSNTVANCTAINA